MKRLAMVGLLIFVVGLGTAVAQSNLGGVIRGTVTDEQGGALPGVTITATTPSATGTFAAVSGVDGTYRLTNLPPGVFKIVAELSGFSTLTRSDIEARAGLTLTVDLVLQLGAMSENVTVTGDAPLLETERAVQAVNITGEFQRALPLTTRRDFTDFLEVTPGVTGRSFIANNGTQVYMLRGTDVENHIVQIDGADIGSPRQSQPTFVKFSSTTVADTQVKTGGADASAPIGVGVVLNVATKSGTNQFHGTLGTSFQPRSWNADNNPDGVPTISDSYDAEVAGGGPIRRDRLWFYGSFRYLNRNSQISRNPQQYAGFKAILPDWEPFDNKTRGKYGFIKVNSQWSSKHQAYAFFQGDGSPEQGSQSTDVEVRSLQTQGGQAAASRLFSAWSDSLSSSAIVAWNNKTNTRHFSDWDEINYPGPQALIYTSAFSSSGRLTGNGLILTTGGLGNISEVPSEKWSVQGDVTYFKRGWGGAHTLQTGVFLQPVLHNITRQQYQNDGFILEESKLQNPADLTSAWVPFHRQYVNQLELTTADYNSEDYAVYVQDSWKPHSRLTIAGGVRVDWIKSYDNIFEIETQQSTELGPRFGVTWLATGNGRNVVHGSASRIAAKPENAFLPNIGGNVRVGVLDRYDTAGDGSFSAVFTTPAQSTTAANRRIDPDRHQPYVDEYLVGYRAQLPRRISVDATFIQREYKDLGAQLDVNGIYTDGVFKGYQDPTQNEIYLLTNNTWNSLVYRGLEFVVGQRTARTQILAGYTRVWDHVEGTWQPNDPASFIQPDAFPNDKGIGTIRGNEPNSLSGTAQTRSPMWIKHTLRVSGSYNAPRDFTISSNMVLLSGPWTGPVVDRIAAPDPAFGPPTITLSNGRVVSNPLATVIRFGYDTRGDNQPQAPTIFTWNARVAKRLVFGAYSIEVAFNILNITNADADQEFFGGTTTTASSGSNQLYSPNFAYAPDGTFRGQNRQAARAAMMSLSFDF